MYRPQRTETDTQLLEDDGWVERRLRGGRDWSESREGRIVVGAE